MAVSPARVAAFEILMRIETTDAYASEMLHAAHFAKLSSADHGLLTELVMGVLRWRGVLDCKIAELTGRSITDRVSGDRVDDSPLLPKSGRSGAPGSGKTPAVATDATRTGHPEKALEKFDVEVLTALRLGVYQLLFLDRVPRHAAVNESVELVKKARKRSAAGLMNAVLRKIERSEIPHFSQAAREVGNPYCSHLSVPSELSHPQWLVERWQRIYGREVTRKICEYDQRAPETAIRLISRPSAGLITFDQLRDVGIQFEPGRLLSRAAIVTSGDITRSAAFRERSLVIQDEASQLVALLVGHGENVLDCCAAPGGKTRIIAERNPDGRIVAMELHPRRAALLRKLVSESNVNVVVGDARKMPFTKKFDRVLVDAPCSGTGTLARNPEIKWRLRAEDILRLQAYQIEILQSVMKQVAPGGRIVYSTCSLEPEENVEVIEKALGRDASFRVVDCGAELERLGGEIVWQGSLVDGPFLRTTPGFHPCDGFFAAVLEKG